MPQVSTYPAGSPRWWLDVLDYRLTARWREMRVFADYYDGRHALAFATSKFRETFGRLFDAFADNWCQLVVDASVERLQIRGSASETTSRPTRTHG